MKPSARDPEPVPLSERTLELLARRAELLRAPMPGEQEEATVWLAELTVGEQRYAFRLEHLRAALPLKLVTQVPLAPARVVGIASFRGQLVTVYSLAALLGISGWRTDPALLLVLELPDSTPVAVDCEQVPKARTLPVSDLERARARETGPLLDLIDPDGEPMRLIDDLGEIIRSAGAQ